MIKANSLIFDEIKAPSGYVFTLRRVAIAWSHPNKS